MPIRKQYKKRKDKGGSFIFSISGDSSNRLRLLRSYTGYSISDILAALFDCVGFPASKDYVPPMHVQELTKDILEKDTELFEAIRKDLDNLGKTANDIFYRTDNS